VSLKRARAEATDGRAFENRAMTKGKKNLCQAKSSTLLALSDSDGYFLYLVSRACNSAMPACGPGCGGCMYAK